MVLIMPGSIQPAADPVQQVEGAPLVEARILVVKYVIGSRREDIQSPTTRSSVE